MINSLSNKINLHSLTREDLVTSLDLWGYSEYYADAVWKQLYRQQASNLDAISIQIINRLADLRDHAYMTYLDPKHKVESEDSGTTKFLLELYDGEAIESVLMFFNGRATLCVSTQVGCAMGCVFCATGQMGFSRHLQPGEIVAQVLHGVRELRNEDQKLRNVVLMGMGEPLHNYQATMKAIDILMDHHGLAIAPRHITLSTVGIPPAIRRLADEDRPFNLAVSLHAAIDDERNLLVPVGRKWSLFDLMDSCRYYTNKTNRRIFFEWALIEGKNDSTEQAHQLGSLLKELDAHVNLIPLNVTGWYGGSPSNHLVAQAFQNVLSAYNIPSTVRQRRGLDISAGCGQLRAKKHNGSN